MALFPVNLDIQDKYCVVVGGGTVALRKVMSLLDCGAFVKVVSPWVITGLADLADNDRVDLELREYEDGDVKDVLLAFAATDNPEVQQLIADEALRNNILLNIADDPERCDFHIPAKIRRGDLLLTISTGGASPALSRKIREELEEQFGDDYKSVIELFAAIREVVISGSENSDENRKLFHQLIDSDIVVFAKEKNWQKVGEILEKYLSLKDVLEIMKNIS